MHTPLLLKRIDDACLKSLEVLSSWILVNVFLKIHGIVALHFVHSSSLIYFTFHLVNICMSWRVAKLGGCELFDYLAPIGLLKISLLNHNGNGMG